WSVVVSHDPRIAVVGTASPACGWADRGAGWLPTYSGFMTFDARLFQTGQVGRERAGVGLAEPEMRHLHPGLDPLVRRQPRGEILGCVRQQTGRDGAAAPDVGEIGADHAARHSLDRVAADAGEPRVDRLAFGRGAGRLAGRCLLRLHPALELPGRLRADPDPHVRVGRAAELGALSVVDSGRVDDERHLIVAPGHDVALATYGWHPERVDHVGPFQVQHDRLADREGKLVGGDDAERGIAELPPPLPAPHFDVER